MTSGFLERTNAVYQTTALKLFIKLVCLSYAMPESSDILVHKKEGNKSWLLYILVVYGMSCLELRKVVFFCIGI